MRAPRDAPGEPREPPALDARADRARHRDRVARRARSRWRRAPRRSRAPSRSAASDAVPTPASRITGTPACSTISVRLYGLRIPMPEPIGEPSGITAAQPDVLEPAREHRVVGRVGQHGEAVGDELLGGDQQLGRVGQQRALVADHLELDPVGLERLARELRGHDRVARGEAAGGVRQHAARRSLEHVDQRVRACGSIRRSATVTISVPRRLDRVGERLQPREAAGAEDQPRAELDARRSTNGSLIRPAPP